MSEDNIAIRNLSSVLLVCGCVLGMMTAAVAQQTEEVVVHAARVVSTGERTASGVPINEVTLTRTAKYGDIDIATPLGGKVFEQRIRQAATSACEELDQKYPNAVPNPSGKDCYTQAVDGAMSEAQKLIDAAVSKSKSSTK